MRYRDLVFLDDLNDQEKNATIFKPSIYKYARFLFKAILFFIVFSYQTIFCLKAQNIAKFYTSSIQEKGTLYYIFPMKLKTCKNNEDFFYDFTSLSSKDSVNVNFSFYEKQKLVIDSICIMNKSIEIKSSTKKIFVEADHNNWKYRYGFTIKNAELIKIFNSKDIPSIYMIYNGVEKTEIKFSKSKWKKQSNIISRIFEMQAMNK